MGLPTSDTELEIYGFKIWRGNIRLKKTSLGKMFVEYNISASWWSNIYT